MTYLQCAIRTWCINLQGDSPILKQEISVICQITAISIAKGNDHQDRNRHC